MKKIGVWLLLAVLGLGAFPKTAGCDILPAGQKPIAAAFILQAGRYADYCEHAAIVKKGDTIASIAKAHYGDENRTDAVLKANPGLVAEKLAIGARIKLPPKKPTPEKADENLSWAFYTYSSMTPVTMPKRIDIGESIPSPGRLPALVAVPTAMVEEFEKAVKEADGKIPPYDFVVKTKGVYFVEDFHVDTLVPEASKAVLMTTTFEFLPKTAATKDSPAQYKVIVKDKTYADAKGEQVAESGFGYLPIVALLGAGLLVYLARRARIGANS
jgi:phage tail protein X